HHYTYTVTDPGQDTFSVNSGYPTCGSGGQLVLASVSQTPTGGSFDCFFPNGPATTSVAIKVTDEDGASTTDSESVPVVHVNNVPPSIAISGDANVNEGSPYSLTLGAVTDPGTDTVASYVVHWGDGNSDTYPTNGVKGHTYADGPSNHAITVDLVDEDGT